jgi:site-specific DNA-adenine methylase
MESVRYPGGKGTCFQRIINLIPPHDTYIETHLGGGAVIRNKAPASLNIAIESDPAAHLLWDQGKFPHVHLIKADAAQWLKTYKPVDHVFIYADPPYLMSTRKTNEKRYNHEYTNVQHVELLETLRDIASPVIQVMISGYWSKLYAEMLDLWNVESFQTMTRGGMATEYLWMSYPPPKYLHDYRYLGDTYRDRERITRKQKRWVNRLLRMPPLERNALLERIANVR